MLNITVSSMAAHMDNGYKFFPISHKLKPGSKVRLFLLKSNNRKRVIKSVKK